MKLRWSVNIANTGAVLQVCLRTKHCQRGLGSEGEFGVRLGNNKYQATEAGMFSLSLRVLVRISVCIAVNQKCLLLIAVTVSANGV